MIYLEKIFLAGGTLPIANFNDYSGNVLNPRKKMILDYEVITNLELLESRYDPRNPEVGSFIEYFNKAVSPFGKRLMRNWILNPLYDVKEINERLDIIEDLINIKTAKKSTKNCEKKNKLQDEPKNSKKNTGTKKNDKTEDIPQSNPISNQGKGNTNHDGKKANNALTQKKTVNP